jgi:hypothetical protein
MPPPPRPELLPGAFVLPAPLPMAPKFPIRLRRPRDNMLRKFAFPAGFEPTAPRLGIWCSIRLSYGNPPPIYPA